MLQILQCERLLIEDVTVKHAATPVSCCESTGYLSLDRVTINDVSCDELPRCTQSQ